MKVHATMRVFRSPLMAFSLIAAWLACTAHRSWAQAPPPPPVTTELTTSGVPHIDHDEYVELEAQFDRGNELMDEESYSKAARTYEAALARWAHPSIRFNLAWAQSRTYQTLKSYHSFERALREGDGILPSDKAALGEQEMARLKAALAVLELTCEQSRVEVRLDGNVVVPSAATPCSRTVVVNAGQRQLVASRPHYDTETWTVDAPMGQVTEVPIKLLPSERIETVRRWAWWKPLIAVGTGALVLAGGLYADVRSAREFQRFDADFAELCALGCAATEIPALYNQRLERAKAIRDLGNISYGVAGAVAITAGILLFLNREKVLKRRPMDERTSGIRLTPTVSRERVSLEATIQF